MDRVQQTPLASYRLITALVLGSVFPACSAGQDLPSHPRTRTIELAVQYLDRGTPREALAEHPERLTLSAGGEDELPQGPVSFDVSEEGLFVISDLLLDRVVLYDDEGGFIEEWRIGFGATSVSFYPGGDSIEAVSSITGDRFVASRTGAPRSVPSARGPGLEPQAVPSLDRSSNRGRVSWVGVRGAEELTVTVDSAGLRLISVDYIGSDQSGNSYVTLETSRGGDLIDVGRQVRMFDPDGRPIARIAEIATEFYVYPEDVFRVSGHRLYQLVPTDSSVLIHVWDTG